MVVGTARRIERHLEPTPGHPALEGRHRGDSAVPAAGGLPPEPGRHHAVRRLVLVAPPTTSAVTVPPETRKPAATGVTAGAVVVRLTPVSGDLAVATKAGILDPVGQPVAGQPPAQIAAVQAATQGARARATRLAVGAINPAVVLPASAQRPAADVAPVTVPPLEGQIEGPDP